MDNLTRCGPLDDMKSIPLESTDLRDVLFLHKHNTRPQIVHFLLFNVPPSLPGGRRFVLDHTFHLPRRYSHRCLHKLPHYSVAVWGRRSSVPWVLVVACRSCLSRRWRSLFYHSSSSCTFSFFVFLLFLFLSGSSSSLELASPSTLIAATTLAVL